MRLVLCRSLEALLQRDRSFAQSFVQDRRALQRIAKLVVQETGRKELRHFSRLQRSAGLHCIVLALRLARIDEFAAELSLPILIAGSLSGVVRYRPGLAHEGQENSAGAQRSSAYSNADDGIVGQMKKISDGSVFWPSTPLSSAQELAAHAVVNPLVRAVLNAGKIPNFFQITIPNIWKPARFILYSLPLNFKKEHPLSPVCFTPSLTTTYARPPRSCFFLDGGHLDTDHRRCRCCGLAGAVVLHMQRCDDVRLFCIVDQRELIFFESAPPSLVHAVTHPVILKAFEVLILSKQRSMCLWPSAVPALRACWCPGALQATDVTRVVELQRTARTSCENPK